MQRTAGRASEKEKERGWVGGKIPPGCNTSRAAAVVDARPGGCVSRGWPAAFPGRPSRSPAPRGSCPAAGHVRWSETWVRRRGASERQSVRARRTHASVRCFGPYVARRQDETKEGRKKDGREPRVQARKHQVSRCAPPLRPRLCSSGPPPVGRPAAVSGAAGEKRGAEAAAARVSVAAVAGLVTVWQPQHTGNDTLRCGP